MLRVIKITACKGERTPVKDDILLSNNVTSITFETACC